MWTQWVCLSLFLTSTVALTVSFIEPRKVLQKRDAAADIKSKFGDLKDNCFPRPGSEGCRCTVKDKEGKENVKLIDTHADCVKPVVVQTAENKAKLNEEFKSKFGNLREGCFPRPRKGCRCAEKDSAGNEITKNYDNSEECTGPLAEDKENKAKLNEELKSKFGSLRDGCFPRPGKGCRCTEKDVQGNEATKLYDSAEECTGPTTQDKENKATLNEEFNKKYGGLKENCFPRPGKGCRCAEKDKEGNEVTKLYDTDAQCKVEEPDCTETECKVSLQHSNCNNWQIRNKRELQRDRSSSPQRASQNVRDPVREKAQANYQAVINELKDKFRGLKEGCFPRPKGCMCVVGKDVDGREITERRLKDADCKCQPGEKGKDCPAVGAR